MQSIKTTQKKLTAKGIKLVVKEKGEEVGRISLYFLKNDLHKKPLCYLEDLFVAKSFRRKGVGTSLAREAIGVAKKNKCYKIIATSRHLNENAHAFYERLGFKNHGLEFRVDL
jgi:ribosomal protein S18 acetylase RimI-like enzyme